MDDPDLLDPDPLHTRRPQSAGGVITFRSTRYRIADIALLLMLAGILLPTVTHAIQLTTHAPVDILIAVCMAVFAAVLYLWILDATNILPFRERWIAKAVYGAAITSILGTGVAVFSSVIHDQVYPYAGEWQLSVWNGSKERLVSRARVLLAYSSTAGCYWGFSESTFLGADSGAVEIEALDPNERTATISLHSSVSKPISVRFRGITISRTQALITAAADDGQDPISIELSRRP